MLVRWSLICIGLSMVACASLSSPGGDSSFEFQNQLTSFPVSPAEAKAGVQTYPFEGKVFEAEWIACQNTAKPDAAIWVLMHDEKDQVAVGSYCQDWQAQSFLQAGYNVITVNRPGFGQSTGAKDFAGTQSQAAVLLAVGEARKSLSGAGELFGVWGHGVGAIAASFFAKQQPSLRWLILGNGIFDTEEALSSSKAWRPQIEQFIAKEGEDGHEHRSIAWMVDGLPANIVLYHGKDNSELSPAAAQNFRDLLVSSQYSVRLETIDGVGHEIAPGKHRQILQFILKPIN